MAIVTVPIVTCGFITPRWPQSKHLAWSTSSKLTTSQWWRMGFKYIINSLICYTCINCSMWSLKGIFILYICFLFLIVFLPHILSIKMQLENVLTALQRISQVLVVYSSQEVQCDVLKCLSAAPHALIHIGVHFSIWTLWF